MALQTITPPVYVGPKQIRDNTASTATLDATGEYVAFVIQAPKTGTIDRLHYYATTVTADGDGLRCRIETVSTTDGSPSGTLVGGSSEVTVAITTANSWNRSGAGLAAAVTKGDLIAVKLASPAAGTTFNGIIRYAFTNSIGPGVNTGITGYVPYVVTGLPAASKIVSGMMDFALEYNDGTTPYIEFALPLSSVTSTSFNNGSTPDERGNLFQVPVPMRVVGVYHQGNPGGASQTFDIVLYDSGSSALGTIAVDGDQYRVVGGASTGQIHYFATPITLAANTNYRLAHKPTTASSMNNIQWVIDTTTGGTRLREAGVGGTTWRLTTRTDGATTGGTLGDGWTQTDDTIVGMGLIVDQFDDGTAVGGASTPYIIGG